MTALLVAATAYIVDGSFNTFCKIRSPFRSGNYFLSRLYILFSKSNRYNT